MDWIDHYSSLNNKAKRDAASRFIDERHLHCSIDAVPIAGGTKHVNGDEHVAGSV